MPVLSITLPSNTFLTNGKQITFRAPCNSKGVTGLVIGNDPDIYYIRNSLKKGLPEDVAVFEEGVMVHVLLDVDNHLAYIQNVGAASGTQDENIVVDFNGRQGSVKPIRGDYTAEMVGAAPEVHASQHAIDGTDPITPESIGAAAAEHSHDDIYASINHNHDGVYAPYHHTHDVEGGIGFSQADADKLYAPIDHTHTPAEIGAASVDHTHTLEELGAAAIDHTHTLEELGAAAAHHTHTLKDLDTSLTLEEIGAAPADHTHQASEIDGLATVATSGSYNDLVDQPTIPDVPTEVSAFTNDAGYITQDDISGKQDKATLVTGSGSITATLNDGEEYLYTNVTSLNLTADGVSCHGMITFGSSVSSANISAIKIAGDDISQAQASEVWEFSCFQGYMVVKKWSD